MTTVEWKVEKGPVTEAQFLVRYEDGVIMYMEELNERIYFNGTLPPHLRRNAEQINCSSCGKKKEHRLDNHCIDCQIE